MNNLTIESNQTKETTITNFIISKKLTQFTDKISQIIESALKAMKDASQIRHLYLIRDRSVHQMRLIQNSNQLKESPEVEEKISQAALFLTREIGSRTITIMMPSHENGLASIVMKVYLDYSHPMDLQKLLQNEKRAPKVIAVLQNLDIMRTQIHPLLQRITLAQISPFNTFLSNYVQRSLAQMSIETKKKQPSCVTNCDTKPKCDQRKATKLLQFNRYFKPTDPK